MLCRIVIAIFVFLPLADSCLAQQLDPDSPRYLAALAAREFLVGDVDTEEFAKNRLAQTLQAGEMLEQSLERLERIRESISGAQLTGLRPEGEFAVVMEFEKADGTIFQGHFELQNQPPHGFTRMWIDDGPALTNDDDKASDKAGDSGSDSTDSDLAARLAERVEKLVADDRFSGTVLVDRNGQTIYQESCGQASKRYQVANNIDTKFNLGSMNKMFTGVAICQLAEQGKLSFEDKIIDHLPDYPNHEVAEQVTIHHLLTHTSGMGSYWNDEYEKRWKTIRTVDGFLPTFADDPLQFTPGQRFGYSNAGPIVLGLIIEKISEKSYYDYVRENIYEPAGMTNTDCYEMDRPVENLAIGYTRSNYDQGRDDGPRRNNLFQHSVKGGPAGGGFSTAPDMLAFSRALQDDVLLKPETRDLMLEGKILNGPDFMYAYLFGHHGKGTLRRHGHNGGAPGISAEFGFYPELGYTYVVLSNYDEGAIPVGETINRLIQQETLRENPDLESAGPAYRVGIAFAQDDDGISVKEAIDGGPAQKAGLQAGDQIQKINGQPLAADWFSLLTEPLDEGSTIKFEIIRDGETLEIDVVPEKIR